ncbi:MAG TPA: hypothetical protein VIL09_14835 [Microvirga sp.]|jgi:hypothetical protein
MAASGMQNPDFVQCAPFRAYKPQSWGDQKPGAKRLAVCFARHVTDAKEGDVHSNYKRAIRRYLVKHPPR